MITPLGKRQKQGSTSINNAECSTSAFNDTDIIFRDSYRDPNNNSRENTNQNCSRSDNLESIIHIDDSPQATNDGSKGVACCRSDEDARARQVEADEALALELQEQLFNETPVFGVDNEVVSLFPLFLLSIHQVHVGNGLWLNWSKPPPSPLRSRSFANTRHSQYQSSVNASRRAPRASNSNRLARWRSRFPGQPRTLLSSTGRNSIFPSNMDVETRMEVLETLEAFSNMGVYGDFLQTQRDFNENDYEMLLALDENNHQHAGASMHQINGLPETTVQNENLEEACSICLENPTMGDTIRHLPCLHKFHKDCIDPWLQRRSSCPVCKSSIT
nr:E3 ubiquitin-protein ligase RLIM isoform X2 [Ipomoea batatas]